jgi:hypothetical protein
MFALLMALVAWVALSVVATPLIGRFLVMREQPEEQRPSRQPARPESRPLPSTPIAASRIQAVGRPNRFRTAAR